jgi:hypothetical protein
MHQSKVPQQPAAVEMTSNTTTDNSDEEREESDGILHEDSSCFESGIFQGQRNSRYVLAQDFGTLREKLLRRLRATPFLVPASLCFFVLVIIGFTALIVAPKGESEHGKKMLYRIGFGSCTSYDIRDQPIWTEGVIPTKVDAWIWAGDIAYLDNPTVQCDLGGGEVSASPECHCETSWLAAMPHSCMAGQVEHAQSRWQKFLHNPAYVEFLEDMCPGEMAKGFFPPIGPKCHRPILGTYDDHDYGW